MIASTACRNFDAADTARNADARAGQRHGPDEHHQRDRAACDPDGRHPAQHAPGDSGAGDASGGCGARASSAAPG